MSKKNWVLHTTEDKTRREDAAEEAAASGKTVASGGEASLSEENLPGTAQLRTTEVDLNGLMTVLGRHLYSTPVVAIRELVQNAHDSIIRRRLEDPLLARSTAEDAPVPLDLRIRVSGDPVKGIIRVTDTGAGLTDSEIHAYLATVGVG